MSPEESIFEIPISLFSRREVFQYVRNLLSGNSFFRIATVGPEFLLRARDEGKFRENLLRADLRVADGFGITFVGWLFGKRVQRFPGSDLLQEILREAEMRNLSIFLALRKDGLSSFEEIQAALLKKYPNLIVTGKEFEKTPHSSLLTTNCSIVFSNFGAPDQEYFLESLRGQVKSVRLVMGVGGAFDFLTKKLPRAPRVFRALGLEWLWRLSLQPKRWRSIWRAVVVFPMLVCVDRLKRGNL